MSFSGDPNSPSPKPDVSSGLAHLFSHFCNPLSLPQLLADFGHLFGLGGCLADLNRFMENGLADCQPLGHGEKFKNPAQGFENQDKGKDRQDVQPIIPEKEFDGLSFVEQKNQVNHKNSDHKIISNLYRQPKGMVLNVDKQFKDDDEKK